jgi:hypothetical protein
LQLVEVTDSGFKQKRTLEAQQITHFLHPELVKKQAFMIAGERSNGVTNEARDNVFDYIGRLHDYRKRIRGAAQDLKLSSCKHPRFSTCL